MQAINPYAQLTHSQYSPTALTLSTHSLHTPLPNPLTPPIISIPSNSEEDDDPDWAFGLDDADDPDALYAPSDSDDDEREMNALYDMNQQVSSDEMTWEVGRRIEERQRKRTQREDGSTRGEPPVTTHTHIYPLRYDTLPSLPL